MGPIQTPCFSAVTVLQIEGGVRESTKKKKEVSVCEKNVISSLRSSVPTAEKHGKHFTLYMDLQLKTHFFFKIKKLKSKEPHID